MIEIGGRIFRRVAKCRRQRVDAVLCVGIGNESADDAESGHTHTHTKEEDIIDRVDSAIHTLQSTYAMRSSKSPKRSPSMTRWHLSPRFSNGSSLAPQRPDISHKNLET